MSNEEFHIVSCQDCNLKFTNPVPATADLGRYYQSEDYISHSDTRKGIVAQLYHAVRAFTLKQKLKLISSIVSRGTILDMGCGTGMFLKTCKDAGWDVAGIEPDPGARSIAIGNGVRVEPSKEEVMGSFDIITLWHVLEHVPDLNETLQWLNSHLKPGGTLLIAVPNNSSFDAGYYGQFWAAYDVPRHLYHFTPDTLQFLLSNHGFQLKDMKPMKFDSYYVSMLSEKYMKGSINYLNAFVTGLKSNTKAKSPADYSSVIYIFSKS